MKKIVSLCLIAVMLLVCLASCGKSVESYVKTLEEAGYEVQIVREEEIDDYAEDMGIEADGASVKQMLYGVKNDLIPKVILIVECVSEEAANEIAASAGALDKLSILGVSLEVDKNCVLVGTTSAVNTAMGK